jgi:16S rRNA (guanine527-N7)-methyltransferase
MLPEGGESPPELFARLLPAAAADFGVALDEASVAGLAGFLSRLDLWRRRTNLTGPFPAEELVAHAVESAYAARLLPWDARVTDIGAGAGFPGIPLAIVRRDIRLTPVEPRRRRREFLDGCRAEIPLPNLAPAVSSAAILAAESTDVAVARAVADLPKIVGQASFLRPRGLLLVWTTQPDNLARQLLPKFQKGETIAVPGAIRKTIALFQKA